MSSRIPHRGKNHSSYPDSAVLPAAILLTMILIIMQISGCNRSFLPGFSPGKDAKEYSRDLFAMDTYMTVTAYGDRSEEAVEEALKEIERLDRLWSVGNPDSEISRINRGESFDLSPETTDLITRSVRLWQETGGAFDITIYPLMEAWGFTSGEFRVPGQQEIGELLTKVDSGALKMDTGTRMLTLPRGMQVDLGGIAKGYTSACIMEIFADYDLDAGLVSLGGNVQTYRHKPDATRWRIGLENPDDTVGQLKDKDYAGVLELEDKAAITSGGYERYFEEDGLTYHHILDPATGYPAHTGLISVTIVSSDGCLADGLSTALFVMGEDKAIEYWRNHREDFDFVLIDDLGQIKISSGLKGAFSTDLDYEVVE